MAYLYLHRRKDTKEVFYVGISNNSNGEYLRTSDHHGRSNFWHSVVKKYGYTKEIYKDGMTWDEACQLEVKLIAKYGRRDLGKGKLVNLSDGGEGIINRNAKSRKISALKTHKSWLKGDHENNCTKVYQYNLKGRLLKEYPSVREAGLATNIREVTISGCCRGVRKRAGKFFWSYKKEIVNIPKFNNSNEIPIIAYDRDTHLVGRFKSQMDAETKLGIKDLNTSICKCLKGELKVSNGMFWFRLETPNRIKNAHMSAYNKKMNVIRVDKLGNKVLFHCLKDAANSVGGNGGNIHACMHGRQETSYGYKWYNQK